MGGKSGGGSGGGSSSMNFGVSNSEYKPNPEAMAAYRRALSLAENVTSQPYEPYQGQLAAPFSVDQMQAFEGTRQMQGMVQPYINAATGLTNQAVNYADPRNFNQQTLQQYQSPYQKQVVDATMANLAQLNAQQEQQGRTAAAQRGTFGGSGEFQGRAEIARQQALANAQTLAGLQQSGYQQAVGQYNQQQQQAIQTAQNAAYGLGQLGAGAQNAAMQGLQALLGTGAQQQQMAQQQLTGAYQQWLQAKAFPYQQAGFYSGIASGIAPNMGGTTTTQSFGMGNQQQQQAQGGGGAAGMGMSVLSMLPSLFGMSDEDDKTDIKYLGEDEETGEKLYSYRYKGDPKSYPKVVGPMAQDIEEDEPERVREVGGHKIVEGLGHLKPSEREHFADGGAGVGTGATAGADALGALSNTQAPTGQTAQSIYDVPAAKATNAGLGALSSSAGTGQGLDPNVSSFVQNIFDPKTADQMARAKWVNQPSEVGQSQYSGDNYVIPPGLMNDGSSAYPYNPQPGTPMARGGRAEKAIGGSFFDLVKQGGAGGPFTQAPDNIAAAGQDIGIGKIIAPATDKAKSITGEAAAAGVKSVMKDAPSGGGGGGGGGAPKIPEMKGPKGHKGAEAAPAADAPSAESAVPQAGAPSAEPAVPQAAPAAEMAAAAPAPVDVAPPMDFAAAAPQIPEIPMLSMGFGGFKHGGRIHKEGGGGAGAMGATAPGGGFGALGQPGAGIGDIVLGSAQSPGELAGIGNLMAGQEKLTGTNLLNKLDTLRFAHSAGPQTTPEQQGMPAMPKSDFYTTPRKDLPSVGQTEHYGEENPNPIPGYMMMAGMGGKGSAGTMGMIGLADQINQGRRAADAAGKRAELKATRESMLKDPANFPVQGYYTNIASPNLNEATGLFNVDYTGAYRGYPYKDGGRVELARGGSSAALEQQAMRYFLNKGYSQAAAAGIVGNLIHESGGKLNAAAKGDYQKGRPTSFGIGQWHADRFTNLQNFAKKMGTDWTDFNTQLAFADAELRSPKYRGTLEKIMSSKTPAEAAGHMVVGFENPKHSRTGYAPSYLGYADRVRQANRIAQAPVDVDAVAPTAGVAPSRTSLAFNRPAMQFPHPSQEPGFTPAAAPPRTGSVRERINPADPSGPLLPEEAPKRGGLLSMINPVSSAAAADRGLYPEGSSGGYEGARARMIAMNNYDPRYDYAPGRVRREEGITTDFAKPLMNTPGYDMHVMEGAGSLHERQPLEMPMSAKPLDETQPVAAADQSTTGEPAQATPAAQAAPQKGLYWGDYRDVENNPFGDFIDELAGDVRTSKTAGTASTPMGKFQGEGGLGALFDLAGTLPAQETPAQETAASTAQPSIDFGNLIPEFARGGMVRHGYATDGSVEEENPLAAIGDGIGSALGSIGDLFSSGDGGSSQVAAADYAQPQQGGGLFGGGKGFTWSPLQSGLLAAGLATMASDRVNPLQAIGEGGLRGLQVYEAAAANQADIDLKNAQSAADRDYARQMAGAGAEPRVASSDEGEVPEGGAAEPSPTLVPQKAAGAAGAAPAAAPAAAPVRPVTIESDPQYSRLAAQRRAILSQPPMTSGQRAYQKQQLDAINDQMRERRDIFKMQQEAEQESRRQAKEAREAERQTPEYQQKLEQQKAESAALSKESVERQLAAENADQRISTLKRMKQGVESGKFYTGLGGEKVLDAKKLAAGIGLPVDEEGIAMAEQFQKDANRSVTEAAGGSLGAGVSNADISFLQMQQPGLGTTKAGNVKALDAAVKIEERKKQIAQFERDYRAEHNGVLDSRFHQALAEWANAHPMFEETKKTAAADKEKPKGEKTIKRTGTTRDGRKVVEYSDGTIDYAK